jgi:hypothetical protein
MRPVSIYIGALSADDELLNAPLQMWAGHMDVMGMSQPEQKMIKSPSIANQNLAAFDRSSG